MAEIIPAILEETLEAFLQKVSVITRVPGVERIQVDFGDGVFVPHRTVPAESIHPLNPAFAWEAHIMTQAPQEFLDYQIAGFSTLIVHFEAYAHEQELRRALATIARQGLKAGLAIKPETEVAVVVPYVDLVSQFTLLSVEPGFQGMPFIEQTYARLQRLKQLLPNAILEVDGGIGKENIAAVAKRGAALLTVGHALFETEHVTANFEALQRAMLG